MVTMPCPIATVRHGISHQTVQPHRTLKCACCALQGTSYGPGNGGGHCSFQISGAATQPWITGINYYVGKCCTCEQTSDARAALYTHVHPRVQKGHGDVPGKGHIWMRSDPHCMSYADMLCAHAAAGGAQYANSRTCGLCLRFRSTSQPANTSICRNML